MLREEDETLLQLSDWRIAREWGGIRPEFMPEKAVVRFQKLLSKEKFEETFPNRMGSKQWKERHPDLQIDEYYSYDNFTNAIKEVSRFKCRIEWRQGMASAYRIFRFDKIDKTEQLVFEVPDFSSEINSELAVEELIVDYGKFLYSSNAIDSIRELAAFLAETGVSSYDNVNNQIIDLKDAFSCNEQLGYDKNSINSRYIKGNIPYFLPVKGKSYHGRGPAYLSYNYNYGYFSAIMFGDEDVLLKNPELLTEDGNIGIQSAILFWMTPKVSNRMSCHAIMTNKWKPREIDIKYGRNEPCFGLMLLAMMSSSVLNREETDPMIRNIVIAYRTLLKIIGNITTDEKCDTLGYI